MADSAFWRELAAAFLLIPSHELLRADGNYIVGSGAPWNWQLAGANEFIHSAFETPATRGAFETAPAGTTDLVGAWLEMIRAERINFRTVLASAQSAGGIIDRVCEASAILCRRLEAQAIQAEFKEKQRNDPKNWSQFRQQYETLKGIKEVRNQPAELISEEFVRNAIARIRGIKPQDVTRQQIAFEVAGLLPSHPHIQLISATPSQEPPTVAEETHVYVGIEQTRRPEPVQPSTPSETIAAQLQRLRIECNWTIEKLAEKTRFDEKTVKRHLSGRANPRLGNVAKYKIAFSKELKREVVIAKTPPKRPPNVR